MSRPLLLDCLAAVLLGTIFAAILFFGLSA